jgi:hypothetical protein
VEIDDDYGSGEEKEDWKGWDGYFGIEKGFAAEKKDEKGSCGI